MKMTRIFIVIEWVTQYPKVIAKKWKIECFINIVFLWIFKIGLEIIFNLKLI